MAKLLEFTTTDGDGVVIASLAPGDDVQAVSRVGDAVQKVEKSLADVLSMVRGVAFSFREALVSAPVESASIELGLQFTAKGNVYVVGAEVQSAIKVSLTVKPPPTSGEAAGAAG
jgi:Trypsin-co-occurring domain 1